MQTQKINKVIRKKILDIFVDLHHLSEVNKRFAFLVILVLLLYDRTFKTTQEY